MCGVVVVPLRGVGRGTLDSLAEEHSSGVVGHVFGHIVCAEVHQYSRFVRKCLVMSGGQGALRLVPPSSTPSSRFLVSYLVTRACGCVASSVWEWAVGLSVFLVHDVSLCVVRMQLT